MSVISSDKFSNIEQTISSMLDKLNDTSSYSDILNTHTELNSLKISYIKYLMNQYVETLDYPKNSKLSPWLGYTLSVLSTSYPHIRSFVDKITEILNKIDQINIHPMIFQMIFINLIHSSYIIELCTNTNKMYNQAEINRIAYVGPEVELVFNQFIPFFDKVDIIFKSTDAYIGYTELSLITSNEFNLILRQIMEDITPFDKQNLSQHLKKLNIMSIYIDHMTEHNINDVFVDIDKNVTEKESDFILKKLDSDIKLLEDIIYTFNNTHLSNTIYAKKFKTFELVEVNFSEFNDNKPIYYWVEYVSILNGKLFNHFFRPSSNEQNINQK
jgi:hypothetical protein